MSQEKIVQPPVPVYPKRVRWATFLGPSTLFVGILLLLFRNWLPEYILASLLILKPDTSLVKSWLKMPVSIPTDVYFFNWTNPEDFDDINIQPRFEQVGPYRFLQNMEKRNVIWNQNNNTVTFNQMRSWHYDDKFTKGKLSDKITSMNAITMSTSHHIRNWNYVIKRAASLLLSTIAPKVHITRTVSQFLFDGYDDTVVDIARYLPFIASDIPRFDRFGWFRLMNGSEKFEGVYNMDTGINGDYEIRQWNYGNVTPFFNGACASVHGSGGELYSRNLSKDHIGIFLSHLCRYLQFDYEEEMMVDGILGYKYSIGDGVLDNGTRIPGNECFCAGDCLPSGMLNISSCRYGTPTYASLPHFYQADSIYLDNVKGLNPQKSKHEAYIVLEPKTGMTLRAVVRLQLNILVHPVEDVSIFQNVRTVFFPLLWVEQDVSLPSDVQLMLRIFLNMPYVICGIAIVLVSVGLYLLIFIAFKPIFIATFKRIHKKRKCEWPDQNLAYFSK